MKKFLVVVISLAFVALAKPGKSKGRVVITYSS